MPRETISGIHDCSKALSIKRGCSIAVAQSMMIDMLDVVESEILRLGGVQFVDRFTIKKHFKPERQGFNPAVEDVITIPERYTLKLTVGKALFEKLNPQCEMPVATTTQFKRVGRFKPNLNIARADTNEDNPLSGDRSMASRFERLLRRDQD